MFPEPLMKRMKKVARRLDIPVSEVVRRATDRWLERFPEQPNDRKKVPIIQAGKCHIGSDDMREAAYE
ncbi:MAG: hypothetical protein AB8F34_13190 [Akkermansiaceae bacterium]